MIYSFAGLPIILLIDFLTFAVAVTVTNMILRHRQLTSHPNTQPNDAIWESTKAGLIYLRSQHGLFWLIIHGTIINFFLSIVLNLSTPYVLTITGSEIMVGVVSGVINLGAIVGAIIIGAWGGTRPRIHTIMPAIIVIACFVIGYGLAQSSIFLVLMAFFMLLPMPMVTTMIPAIIQSKTPEHMQGRIFAVVFQLASLANPIALLMTSYVIDNLLNPAISTPAWSLVALLVGDEAGTDMRLLTVVSGCLMLMVTVLFYSNISVRNVENDQSFTR